MYKRKVRIYFLDDGQVPLALVASAYAKTLGEEWLEARAAGKMSLDDQIRDILQRENITTPCATDNANGVDVTWADLIITIGDRAKIPVPPLSETTQIRHWPVRVKNLANPEQVQLVCDEIRHRVSGIVGGITLLAKTDGTGDPPT